LPARALMGRSCGLSHVIGSTPVAGSICRPSSMVEQPPHVCGVIPRRPLPIRFLSPRGR